MFSSRFVQIAAVFSDVFGQALPNLCRSFYNETKAEMFFSVFAVALLAEGVDRNSRAATISRCNQPSPSLRRAWIEMSHAYFQSGQPYRSPSLRRAWIEIPEVARRCYSRDVALLAEGVDRNAFAFISRAPLPVALLAEGVDRNVYAKIEAKSRKTSPSLRRAWIEIGWMPSCCRTSACRPPCGGRG